MYHKKHIVIAAIAVLASLVFISAVSAKTTTFSATVTADTLYVRSGPGKSYDKVGHLEKGATVKVYEQTKNWSRIGTGKKWVMTAYLTKTKTVKTASISPTAAAAKGAPAGCLQAVAEANTYCKSVASGCPSWSTTPQCLEANQKCEDRQQIAFQQCPQN